MENENALLSFFFFVLEIRKLKLRLSNLPKISTRKWQSYDMDPCLFSFKTHDLNPYIYYPFNEVICDKAKRQKSTYNNKKP